VSDSQTRSPALFDTSSTAGTKSIDWFGTVRGRVGFLATPQWRLYGTGGLPVVFSTSTAFREQIVRVGLNYHFNGTGPAVAKY
jgi:outer membrane immunogenic protein